MQSQRDKIESQDQETYCLYYLDRLLISTTDITVNEKSSTVLSAIGIPRKDSMINDAWDGMVFRSEVGLALCLEEGVEY